MITSLHYTMRPTFLSHMVVYLRYIHGIFEMYLRYILGHSEEYMNMPCFGAFRENYHKNVREDVFRYILSIFGYECNSCMKASVFEVFECVLYVLYYSFNMIMCLNFSAIHRIFSCAQRSSLEFADLPLPLLLFEHGRPDTFPDAAF